MVNFLWDRGRPRPPVAQKASGRKLFVLRTGAGEGGPSKSGYQRPYLEFQTDPLPFPVPLLLSSYSAFLTNRTGFSCEVSVFISAVALTRRVRRMNKVETIRVIVQATPPSMP